MQLDTLLPPTAPNPRSLDRVRLSTPPDINQRLDEAMMKRIWSYAHQSSELISERICELDREWDFERILETNAAGLALSGVVLGIVSSRKWLLLPGVVLGLLLQHSLTRRSAPVLLLRRLGIRTRREIESEKYAMRMLRGDFDQLQSVSEETHRAIEAYRLNRP
jgi:hypothetical protein